MRKEPTKLEKERGERVRFLREKVLGISSRIDLVRQSEGLITLGSLENWELGRHGGLVEKAAPKLVQAALALNVKCSIEWLLWGVGDFPKFFNPNDPQNETEDNDFKDELISLRKEYPNLIDTVVEDDAMAPCFLPGDYVAGEQCFGDKLLEAIGKACIIQTKSGESMIRLLKNGNPIKGYMVVCTNPDTKIKPAQLQINDNDMFCAAPIVWMRRKK